MNEHDANGEAMSEQELSMCERHAADDLINQWVLWCRTRRIFVPAAKSNVLARLRPVRRTHTEEPDAFLDAEMPFLNMAIQTLCDRDELAGEAECFLAVYVYRKNIKTLAYEQKCTRGTVYNRARRFAIRAKALGRSISRKHACYRPMKDRPSA